MIRALKEHWPEYVIEAAALGTFMVSAALFTALLEYPDSTVHQAIPNGFLRTALNGLAMGLTAIGIIYSPWGQQSGAHMNPALTLTFLRLGKIKPWDALFYIVGQTGGGVSGVLFAKLLLGGVIEHPSVNYVVTVPGPAGVSVAFLAETMIAGGMMLMVLSATNTPRLARFTGLFGGMLVFLCITFESPLSGMSINPARTAASALPSGTWTAAWIYFTAPIFGMFLAAEVYRALRGLTHLACPKYDHGTKQRCIFCGFPGARTALSAGRRSADQRADSAVRAPARL
jgi:aquaporin Z